MFDDSVVPIGPVELRRIIRQARRRWRAKLAVRGAAIVVGCGLAVLLASAYALEALTFSPAAVLGLRALVVFAFAGLAVWFLARPLLRRVTDEQVALYLEEHHPAFEAMLVSAVDASSAGPETERRHSHALVLRLVNAAIDRCSLLGAPHDSERTPLRAYAGMLLLACAVSSLFVLFGPAYLRRAVTALLHLSQDVEAASPYRIDVQPGSARLPRGADQRITARLSGFTAEDAVLVSRSATGGGFERLPMLRLEDGTFAVMLFDLADGTDYHVEAAGVRSARYTLTVLDLPYVRRLDLELVFPGHTALAPEIIRDGGDIAALVGTDVRVTAFTTIPAAGGRLLLDERESFPLTRATDGTLTGRFRIVRDGFYRVELETDSGERVSASPQYTIDALDDRPPSVRFTRPRRDVEATAIEEVFVEAQAEDDYGVRDLQLVYSVNGGAARAVGLYRGGVPSRKEISAGHTFYLEEFGLSPGDFVSYYARVGDNDAGAGAKSSTSDLYFVRIRPFNKEFQPAQSQSGGGGGGDMGMLSEQQRQIVTGTFNLVRDRRALTPDRLREGTVVLALSQGRLREQVEALATRMADRLVGARPEFSGVAGLLPKAAEEMRAAEQRLQARDQEAALAPEQRALRLLQQAEQQYQVQVSMNRNGGGGAGGGSGYSEDLADLFKMELDRLANQYETPGRADSRGGGQQLDELAERLREIARRQEQEAERRRRAAGGAALPAGADSQRALADQAEEAARRLERLAREEARPELIDAARQLQQAADAMRRAAAGSAGAAGQAGSALDRLRDAQDRLARERQAHAARSLDDAVQEAESLAREQRDIAGEVGRLGESSDNARREGTRRLAQRKDELEARVAELEQRLAATASGIQHEQHEASQKLREAAGSIRDNLVKERIRFSKEVMRRGTREQAEAFENAISGGLQSLRDKLDEAASALGRASADATTDALDRARSLARGLDSLERRSQERRSEQGPGQAPGSPGGPAEPADAGRPAGETEGPGRTGRGGATGGPAGGGAGGGPYSPEDRRQFRGEVRRWTAEAQELARRLRGQDVDTRELEAVLRGLQELDSDRVFGDSSELARLQAAVAEGAKRFEFRLRRQVGSEPAPASLSGSEEVPETFRPLVEEYYRSLSRRPPG